MVSIASKRFRGHKSKGLLTQCTKEGDVLGNIKIEKEILYNLYITERLNCNQIADIHNCGISDIKYNLRKHNITKKENNDNYKLDMRQRDLVIGSALGDGYLQLKNGTTSMKVSHAEDQKDYCKMKFNIVSELCNYGDLKFVKRSDDSDSNKRKDQYYFSTKNLLVLNQYHQMSISEFLDELNENSLTIWLLDDGHKYEPRGKNKNSSYEISVGRFQFEEVEYAQKVFLERFNIVSGVKYNEKWKNPQYTLTFDVEQSYLLSELIRNSDFGYIAEQSMSYKLIDSIHINRITKNYRIVREGTAKVTAS
jgi:hypothetical protein